MLHLQINHGPLTRLSAALTRPDALMAQIADALHDEVMKNFAAEGRPKWAPWTPAYAAQRQGGKMLVLTGRLKASFTKSHTATTATVKSTGVPYAGIHQFGGRTRPHEIRPRNVKALFFNGQFYAKVNHPGSRIPARPMLPLDAKGNPTPEAQARIQQAVNQWLARII